MVGWQCKKWFVGNGWLAMQKKKSNKLKKKWFVWNGWLAVQKMICRKWLVSNAKKKSQISSKRNDLYEMVG